MPTVGCDRFPSGDAVALFTALREYSSQIWIADARAEHLVDSCGTNGWSMLKEIHSFIIV